VTSYVYVVRSRATGFIKIGHSLAPAARIRQIERGKVDILAVFEGSMADERRLHHRFSDDWLRGEWFRASAALMAWICGLGSPPDPSALPILPPKLRAPGRPIYPAFIGIRISRPHKQGLIALARRHRRTVAEEVRIAIEQHAA
jgi:hypothetical protein